MDNVKRAYEEIIQNYALTIENIMNHAKQTQKK
jgi:hypothetical protein